MISLLNKIFPRQKKQTTKPGMESAMHPLPESVHTKYKPAEKLKDKVAIITGADSGIGRAIALTYVLEGAKIVIVYLNEHEDALATKEAIHKMGGECILIAGDIGDPEFCERVAHRTVEAFGKINILVNNAGELTLCKKFEDITPRQLERTFRTNIFGMFYMVHAVLRYMKGGSVIINTASSSAYQGEKELVDYSSSKGAVVAFTRALSQNILDRKIRVNAVSPGPIWTPIIQSNFSAKEIAETAAEVPMKRLGQPSEVAPAYVFLATDDASFMTGQVMHPNGGIVYNT